MLNKRLNDSGGKAWQRDDKEDRTIPYKEWINSNDTNGFFLDIDAIKWKTINGEYIPIAITELTACEWETIATLKYLQAIEDRIFNRDKQGHAIKKLGLLLNIPVFWVVFPPSVKWLYVYSLRAKKWKLFNQEEWISFLKKL